MKKYNISKEKVSAFLRYFFAASIAITSFSCDPSLDEFAYDLPDEGDLEDTIFPTADFDYEEFFAADGSSVTLLFTNLSTSAGIHSWDFGDGQVSDEANPSVIFEIPSDATEDIEYTIELTSSDNFGVSDIVSKNYVINVDEIEIIELPTDGYTLINTGDDTDVVEVVDFSSEQSEPAFAGKFNYASNILDKDGGIGGNTTVWTSNDETTGDNLGDGEYVIIDLGAEYDLGLIQFKTDNKSDPYGYQLLTSTTGITDADFAMLYPSGGTVGTDLAFTSGGGNTDFQVLEFDTTVTARYVKLIAYGRYSAADFVTQTSGWSNFAEIEFWTPEL